MSFLFSCKTPNQVKSNQTLLIGMDGAEWKMLYPLMKTGNLPVFQRLIKSGTYGRLFSPTMVSPTEWTSTVTGKSAAKHGISSWAINKNKGKRKKIFEVITRKNRTCTTIWNILSNKGFHVSFVGWWATWPAEKINGVMFTDSFIYRKSLSKTTYPELYATQIQNLIEKSDLENSKWLKNHGLNEDYWHNWISSDIRYLSNQVSSFYTHLRFDFLKWEVTKSLLDNQKDDLTGVYFRASDLASHFFYKECCLENGETPWTISDEDRIKFGGVMPALYKLYDHFLDGLLQKTTTLPITIITSDHGFGSGRYYKKFNFKKLFSFFHISNKNNSLHLNITIKQISPTTGRLIIPATSDNNNAKIHSFLSKLKNSLQNVTCDNKKPLFRNITNIDFSKHNTQVLGLKLIVNPDVKLTDNIYFQDYQQFAYKFFRFSKFSGFHRPYGIVILNGFPFRKNHLINENISTWDITPLILRLFHLPRAIDMDGKTIKNLVSNMYNLQNSIHEEIETYESNQLDNKETIPDIAPSVNKKIVKELKSIGYI